MRHSFPDQGTERKTEKSHFYADWRGNAGRRVGAVGIYPAIKVLSNGYVDCVLARMYT